MWKIQKIKIGMSNKCLVNLSETEAELNQIQNKCMFNLT